MQLPRLESEVRAKQRELADVDRGLLAKMAEHDDTVAQLRAKQAETTKLESTVATMKQQVGVWGGGGEKRVSTGKERVIEQGGERGWLWHQIADYEDLVCSCLLRMQTQLSWSLL